MRFGRLMLMQYDEKDKRYAFYWCDCGEICRKDKYAVEDGRTTSCGCWRRERSKQNFRKHGMAYKVPEYQVWKDIRKRCNNKNHKFYDRYGGRGIKVCDRWNNFKNFYDDMGSRPSSEYEIDRINNDGNYEPDNCRWVTHKEEMNNTSANHLIEFNGKTQTMTQWSEEIGISIQTLANRINTHKWFIERALTTPVIDQNKYITYNGETLTISEWSELLGISKDLLRFRINKWGLDKAFQYDKTKTLSYLAKQNDLSYQLVWKRVNELGWTVEKAITTPRSH